MSGDEPEAIVERAARAIHGEDMTGAFDNLNSSVKAKYRRLARAAIAALPRRPQRE